jgi:putative addiction module component (TIGR02574 family)
MVSDLLGLPLQEKLELVQAFWDSIAAEQAGPALSEADRELINERLERFSADGNLGRDAEAVLAELEAAL